MYSWQLQSGLGYRSSPFVTWKDFSGASICAKLSVKRAEDNPEEEEECEAKVQETGGVWNDESETFAGVMLLCSSCYDLAKAINIAATDMPEVAE